jgi:menaquinone-dependent protoporphyrinogen oxidase
MKVLVAAATKYRATAEIADAIGEVLSKRGLEVTVLQPEQVPGVDGYDAVVLGSAVYTGHWMPEASEFARRYDHALATRPLWLFSSGPVGDPGGKLAQAMGKDPVEIAEIRQATHARDHRMFAGKLERRHLGLLQRTALLVVRGLEGDFRDWGAIRAWAAEIAGSLSG